MSCKLDRFKVQSEASKISIQKQIQKHQLENEIEVYDYVGDSETQYIENTTIHLTSNDDAHNTYDKTIECLKYIKNNIEFDYVFRTNTSTFINVKLLYEFIKYVKPNDTMWCSELYATNNVKCPNEYDMYGRGNGMIMSRNIVDFIIYNYKYGYNVTEQNKHKNDEFIISDDSSIGCIFNSIYGNETIHYIKSFPHGWYKCNDYKDGEKGNSLCNWSNTNNSYDFLSQFITIQLKDYKNRVSIQIDKFMELTDIIMSQPFDKERILDAVMYSLNPSVFLGYWTKLIYCDFKTWLKETTKYKLSKNI